MMLLVKAKINRSSRLGPRFIMVAFLILTFIWRALAIAEAAVKIDKLMTGIDRGPSFVSFASRKVGFGAETGGRGIWVTEDAGVTWTKVKNFNAETGNAWNFIGNIMLTENLGFLAGEEQVTSTTWQPRFFRVTRSVVDGVSQWAFTEVTDFPWGKGIRVYGQPYVFQFFDTNNGTLINRNGDVYKTTNGGTTWNRIVDPVSNKTVHMLGNTSANVGYAVDDKTSFYKTTDGWQTAVNPTPVTATDGTVPKRLNFGVAIPGITPGVDDYLGAVDINATPNKLFFYSTDAGATWHVSTLGTSVGQRVTGWRNSQTGTISLLVGDNQRVYYSTDGGQNWTLINAIGNSPVAPISYDSNGAILLTSNEIGRFQFNEIDLLASSIEVSPGSGSKAADGQEYFEVTVTVRDKASGAPMPEVKVNLESDRPEDIIVPATGYVLDKRCYPGVLTDGSGKAKFYVKSTKKGTAHLSAYVNLNQQVGGAGYTKSVDFKVAVGPASTIKILSSDEPPQDLTTAGAPADGEPRKVSINLKDYEEAPIAGASFTLRSDRNRDYNNDGSIAEDEIWDQLCADASGSPDGNWGAQITVTTDSNGQATVWTKTIKTTRTIGEETRAAATFSVTASLGGEDFAGSIAQEVHFNQALSSNNSVVNFTKQHDPVRANGKDSYDLKVELRDYEGLPFLTSTRVAVTSDRNSGGGTVDTLSPSSPVDTTSGEVTFTVKTVKKGTATLTVTAVPKEFVGKPEEPAQTVTLPPQALTFIAAASPQFSKVTVSAPTDGEPVAADGTSGYQVRVELRDYENMLIPDRAVRLSGTGLKVEPDSGRTGTADPGICDFTVTASTPVEAVTLALQVGEGADEAWEGLELNEPLALTFKPALTGVAVSVKSVLANGLMFGSGADQVPTSQVPADGVSYAEVTVQLNGDAGMISGRKVLLTETANPPLLDAQKGIIELAPGYSEGRTDTSGKIVFRVRTSQAIGAEGLVVGFKATVLYDSAAGTGTATFCQDTYGPRVVSQKDPSGKDVYLYDPKLNGDPNNDATRPVTVVFNERVDITAATIEVKRLDGKGDQVVGPTGTKVYAYEEGTWQVSEVTLDAATGLKGYKLEWTHPRFSLSSETVTIEYQLTLKGVKGETDRREFVSPWPAGGWIFSCVDKLSPQIKTTASGALLVTPKPGEVEVGTEDGTGSYTAQVQITFSEELKSDEADTPQLLDPAGQPLVANGAPRNDFLQVFKQVLEADGSLAWEAAAEVSIPGEGITYTKNPSVLSFQLVGLVPNTVYRVRVGAAVCDFANNVLEGAKEWEFHTVDITTPQVATRAPAGSGLGNQASPTLIAEGSFDPGWPLALTWDSPVAEATGTVMLEVSSDSGATWTTVSGVGISPEEGAAHFDKTVKIALAGGARWEYNKLYRLQLTGFQEAIADPYDQDGDGYLLKNPAEDTWYFMLEDKEKPTVVGVFPADQTRDVPVDAATLTQNRTLRVEFSELSVFPADWRPEVSYLDTQGNKQISNFAWESENSVAWQGRIIARVWVGKPTQDLLPNTAYIVTVPLEMVTDEAGHSVVDSQGHIITSYAWGFSTEGERQSGTIAADQDGHLWNWAGIEVPAGALPEGMTTATLTLREVSDATRRVLATAVPTGKGLIPSVYEFWLGETQTPATFQSSVTISLPYWEIEGKPGRVLDLLGREVREDSLRAYWWDEAKQTWVFMGGTVDLTRNRVTFQTNHLSIYGLIGEGVPETLLGGVSLTLNPLSRTEPARQSTTLKFWLGKAARVTLRIYDRRGNLVTTPIEGDYPAGFYTPSWDGRASGRPLPPGIYVYVLTAVATDGEKATQKGTIGIIP